MGSRKEEKFNFHVHNNINKLGRTRRCGTLGIAGFGADKVFTLVKLLGLDWI